MTRYVFRLLDFSDTNEILIFARDEQGLGLFQQRIRIRSWIYFISQNVVYGNYGNAKLSAQLKRSQRLAVPLLWYCHFLNAKAWS